MSSLIEIIAGLTTSPHFHGSMVVITGYCTALQAWGIMA